MEKVVVVIPAYNEAPVIRGVVEAVRALGYEVLVVDDGSTDRTFAEALNGGARAMRNDLNQGVGATLVLGTQVACNIGYDAVVTFDADGQHDPADIPKLVEALTNPYWAYDLVNGSRFLGRVTGMPKHRAFLLHLVRWAMWLLCGQQITDPCNGMKAFRPSTFKIRSRRMAWACELIWRVSRWGKIREVPVSVRYTPYSLAKGQRSRHAFKVGIELASAILRGDR